MNKLLESAISGELIFVYGLIALVVILIITIVIIDRKESNKKPKNLFDTLNMKIITEPYSSSKEKVENSQSDIIEVQQQVKETNFHDLEPIPEIQTIASSDDVKVLTDHNEPIIDNNYIETDLEKTQAQIRVEEITNALKSAQIEEQILEDKYTKFEEEQEKNAIISYNELKKSFDRLYSENEKIQYLEDNEIPINIEELYQLNNQKQESNKEELPKVKLDDLSNLTTHKAESSQPTSTFKSSPLISPVYGIQEPPVQMKSTLDVDIQNANQFLQNLKELKNNLD